jgi:signal transduction histidine kinase
MRDDLRTEALATELEHAASARLGAAVLRLLDVPAGGERALQRLADAVAAHSPTVDVTIIRAHRGGFSPAAGAAGQGDELAPSGAAPSGGDGEGERIPLLGGAGELLGEAVFSSRGGGALTEEDRILARVAAERAARVMERARLEADLSRAEEAARRTSAFRDQILAIVGHDLRNPLGAIVMSAALLQKKGALGGWQAKTVERVRASAARMGQIIDDLLSYTRTRLGTGIPIAPRPTDFRDVTRRVVEELAVAHPGMLVEISAEGDSTGEWDPDRLGQVVSNLVLNAIDHGEEGYPVKVSLRDEGEDVVVDVQNRGEMPQQVIEHAFEAFQRGPEQTGRKASGLGLGLYIAREIVRQHGGDIAVRSDEGATRIALRLPRRCVAGGGASVPAEGR